MPLRAFDRNSYLPESHPTAHSSKVPVMLRHAANVVHDPAGHQPKITGIQRQIDVREFGHHAVKDKITKPQRQRLFSPHTLGVHHLVSFSKLFQELWDDLRNILQIAIHYHDRIARDMIQSCSNRRLMPKVPGERNRHDARILTGCLAEHFEGPIRAAIVHKYDLVRPGRESIEHSLNAQQKLRQNALFIMDRNRDRETNSGGHQLKASSFLSDNLKLNAPEPEQHSVRAKPRYLYLHGTTSSKHSDHGMDEHENATGGAHSNRFVGRVAEPLQVALGALGFAGSTDAAAMPD